jgi:hypothetical protein
MADPLRNEKSIPIRPSAPPAPDEQSIDQLLAGLPPSADSTVPGQTSPRLNRTAEGIGSALGTTVGRVRSGLTLVQRREREIARDLSETVSQQAENLSAAVVEQVDRITDVAEERVSQFTRALNEEMGVLRFRAATRIKELRKQAATARDEHPVEAILAIAGAAFVLGFALRIWRSGNDY